MQNFSFNGRVLATPVLTLTDDCSYCKITVVEATKRSGKQTRIEFVAFNQTAEDVVKKIEVGDFISIQSIITNTSYEKDGVNYHGFSFAISHFEYCGPGKTKLARMQTQQH